MNPRTMQTLLGSSELRASQPALPHRLMRKSTECLVAAGLALASTTLSYGAAVFDNMSNFEASNPNVTIASTGSTPNTFMGDGYVLTSGTTFITGFDIYPVNLSGNNYTGIKINIF